MCYNSARFADGVRRWAGAWQWPIGIKPGRIYPRHLQIENEGCVRADLIGEAASQIVAHAHAPLVEIGLVARTAPPDTLSTAAAGERRDPAGVQPSGAQRGEDALARWREIAQCDAGILPCQQPPRKGSPAQQDE
jgi:hypothetical protein